MVPVFGITIVGCDDGSTNDKTNNGLNSGANNGTNSGGNNGTNGGGNPFVGSWRNSTTSSGITVTQTITFNANLSLVWVVSSNSSYVVGSTSYGTYTYNGNNATLNVNGGTTIITLNNSSSFTAGGGTFTKQ